GTLKSSPLSYRPMFRICSGHGSNNPPSAKRRRPCGRTADWTCQETETESTECEHWDHSRPSASERSTRQPVYRRLENHRRRVAVDSCRAFGAADVLRDHVAFGAGGGPALVPQQDGEAERREVAGESAARLRPRAGTAVHVERQADDH